MEILDQNGLSHVIEKIYDVVHSGGSADYIVEEGTNGVWRYRKWASGIAECWADFAFSATTLTSVNIAGTLPTGIMDTTSQKDIFASGSFTGIVDSHVGYARCSNAGYYDVYLIRSSSSSAAGSVKIEIKGLWKTFTPTAVPSIYVPVADYIVEEGTWLSGKYIKWNSGMAECYGYTSLTSAISSSYGSGGIYYKDTSVSFPSTLFKSGTAPTVDITMQRNGGLLWPSIHGLTNTAVAFYIGSATAESSATIYIHVIAKGVWK